MIVGFTITDFKGQEQAAVEYIRKVCILETPDIAQNIVDAGPGVNIFSDAITLSELRAQPFSADTIEVQDGRYLVVSAVNFNIELLYNGEILRLTPTEYIDVSPEEVSQFKEYLGNGIIAIIPEIPVDGKEWILSDGSWNDEGIWDDSNFWRE